MARRLKAYAEMTRNERYEQTAKAEDAIGDNFYNVIYEGWTVGDFIERFDPMLEQIMTENSTYKPLTSKKKLTAWIVSNQPFTKKENSSDCKVFCSEIQHKVKRERRKHYGYRVENMPLL